MIIQKSVKSGTEFTFCLLMSMLIKAFQNACIDVCSKPTSIKRYYQAQIKCRSFFGGQTGIVGRCSSKTHIIAAHVGYHNGRDNYSCSATFTLNSKFMGY